MKLSAIIVAAVLTLAPVTSQAAGPLWLDRVQGTSTTTGTNDFRLGTTPLAGLQAWSVVGNGNTAYYVATDPVGDWEIGLGTYSSTGPTLARTSILSSSAGNSKVSFPAGVKTISLTPPAAWFTAVTAAAVTSVGLSAPTEFSVSGSPVTTSGTLALSWANPVSVAHGGTGLSSGTSGGIPYFSGPTTMASSSLLTQNALMIGGGAGLAPSVLGSLGTTTTVLHGNAVGLPSFGQVANADLVNTGTTVNGQTCTLGSTCTVTAAPSGSAGGDLSGTYPNPTVAKVAGVTPSSYALGLLPVTAGWSNEQSFADLATAFGSATQLEIPSGTYSLGSNLEPAQANLAVHIDPSANLYGGVGLLDFGHYITNQSHPNLSYDMLAKSYGSEANGYSNIFQRSSVVQSTTSAPVVADFGEGIATGTGSVWGSNFVGYANSATGTGIGTEINYGSLVNGGLAYGVVITSAGNFQPQNALQIGTNNSNSKPIIGIRFNIPSFGLATDSLIKSASNAGTTAAANGIDFSQHPFSTSEINTESFKVAATPANVVSKVLITGAATGVSASVGVESTDTDVSLNLTGKGKGRIKDKTFDIPFIVAQSGAASSVTGTVTPTTLATVTIPANSMGANGAIRVTAIWSYTNSANNKTMKITFGGSDYMARTETTTANQMYSVLIINRNATNSQVGHQGGSATGGWTPGSGAVATSAADTTTSQNLTFSGTLANTGETITLEGYTVEVSPQS